MQANLVPIGEHKASNGHSPIVQFFVNIQILATHNREQVVVLFGMLFTLIVWIFSALSLLVAVLFYLTFLWHHIPNKDRGLSKYCRRKIDSRLQKIVGVKVNKALAKVNTYRTGCEARAIKNGKPHAQILRQPTLPILDTESDDKFQDRPSLSRQTTQTTLPLYASRQSSRRSDHSSKSPYGEAPIPDMFPLPCRPLPPSRSTTQSSALSNASYASHAPLMGEAAGMGYGPPSPTYSSDLLSRMDSDRRVKPPVRPSFTARPNFTQRSYHSARELSPSPYRRTPGPVRLGPPSRQNTSTRELELLETRARSPILHHPFGLEEQISLDDDYKRRTSGSQSSRGAPAQRFEMQPQRPVELLARNEYVAFDPNLHGSQTGTSQPNFANRPAPTRNFTMPIKPYQVHQSAYQQHQFAPPQRSGTAPSGTSTHTSHNGFPLASYALTDDDEIPRVKLPPRAATAGPSDGLDGRRRLS